MQLIKQRHFLKRTSYFSRINVKNAICTDRHNKEFACNKEKVTVKDFDKNRASAKLRSLIAFLRINSIRHTDISQMYGRELHAKLHNLSDDLEPKRNTDDARKLEF